uniref:G_PROTEIN_RECEP_F1_2 domain-containing protein n=1 Tax=Bursaphelenchus xylophilus TaxID=6326 RepID=A0A1I7SGQ0_BURXY
MNLLLFDKKKFDRLYNCTLYDAGYFDAVKTPNAFVGTLYIFAGIAYELLYIPCLITMSKEKFLKSSCYKFMFFLGIIDILTIPFNATLYGWFALQGGVFCDNPMLEYFAGALTTALWCAASMTCVLLAINRLCDLATVNLMQLFFSGHRTYFWCILPVIYFYYFFMYTKPFMSTAAFYAGFSNPYVGTAFQAQTDAEYMNLSLIIHNIVIPISMVLIYTFICAVMIYKTMKQKSTGESGLSKHQKTVGYLDKILR